MAKFDKVIPPGQEGKIEMSVEGAKVHGEFAKSATVHSNDPDHPELSITIAGKEIPYVNVQPDGTIYLHGRYLEEVEKAITISSNEKDKDFKIVNVTSNIDDKITYRVDPGSKPNEYILRVWKNPKLPTLTMFGSIFVHTNSEKAPDRTLQVQVMTKGSISVRPSVLNYGNIPFAHEAKAAAAVTKSVTLHKSNGEFEVRDITMSNERFKARVEAITPGKEYRVEVEFEPPVKKQERQSELGEMIIHTNDPLEPALRVQLVARAM